MIQVNRVAACKTCEVLKITKDQEDAAAAL
jgi:hypothetical protein